MKVKLKKKITKYQGNSVGFFESRKIDKPLAWLTKNKRENKAQISEISGEKKESYNQHQWNT